MKRFLGEVNAGCLLPRLVSEFMPLAAGSAMMCTYKEETAEGESDLSNILYIYRCKANVYCSLITYAVLESKFKKHFRYKVRW